MHVPCCPPATYPNFKLQNARLLERIAVLEAEKETAWAELEEMTSITPTGTQVCRSKHLL